MEPFTAAPHHDVLVLLTQVAVLLFAARAMGEVAQRLGQPSVVGEILAGIVLGPSLLSGLVPAVGAWLVPQTPLQGHLLETVSMIGAIFLLLITGLETDLALIRRHARTAIAVSFGGILVTFSSGFLLGWYLPDFLLAKPDERLVFALFVATAMSISAIPVIAKVLMDLNLMRRDIGQTIIAAGMSDDTIGWILLSIVAGLASAGVVTAGSVLSAVGRVVAFMIISFTVGRWLVKRLLDFVQDETVSPDRLVTLVVALTFAWGAVTQALHLEAVLGAFVMGILFGQMPRLPEATHQKLITIAIGVFTPIFFATAGLKVNVRELLEPRLIALTLLVVFVAMAGKITGTYAGARLIGRREHWTALAFGAGLNARGAMEIIIATIGLQLGILSREMFSIVVLMAMATSLMAPPAMRFVLKRIRPEQQELDRLKREALADESWIARVHRVLLPARERRVSDETRRLEAFLLERMSRNGPLSLTLLTVTEADRKEGAAAFMDELAKRFGGIELTRKVVVGSAAGQVILDEARKDYDVILLGATERPPGAGVLFHPLIDETVRMAPCPTLVARGGPLADGWVPRRILVPTNGSQAARNAAELAFVLAGEPEQEVTVLHVIQERAGAFHPYTRSHAVERDAEMARGIVDELRQLGDAHGVRTRALVRRSSDPEREILELTHAGQAELVIIGTDVRPASGRLYLGPRVERVLESAACPVVVVNSA